MASTSSSPCALELKMRPLTITSQDTRVSIPVSTTTNVWLAAEILREQFTHRQQIIDNDAFPAAADGPELGPRLVLAFAAFVARSVGQPCFNELLLDILKHFTATYLANTDVHTFVNGYDHDLRKSLLTDYFFALSTLEAHFSVDDVPRSPPSALLTAAKDGKASIYALFGGQGTNEVYFDELKALYDIYKPYVASLIVTISKDVLEPLAMKAETEGYAFYSYGLDVLSWLDGSVPVPPVEYLASIPISFPLIGLTQLVQYLSTCSALNATPGDVRELIQGTTGHSQGIVSSICIATSTTVASFIENASKALKWLFYSGLRGQEAFPALALEPRIVKDAVEGGEGVPTPMLSVTGLALDVLERHIKDTNKHLTWNSKLAICLYNGPKAFVVTGPPKALYGLVTSLRKIRAPTGLDQSKVPFSQRKAVFSTRFLVVGVPYHSSYLDGLSEKVCTVDLEGEELWTTEDLAIPVYHTENGTDLRECNESLTRSLCDQISIQPIRWTAATAFPETATHVVDFGPGGLSGIGSLTARNMEGRGIRTIIIGEKGKGASELYSVAGVTYEVWWNKTFAPRLVKTADGRLQIDTPFSRLLGKPPLMVAGMTPTTVKAGFVSATLRAGYHIELAGGGHYNAAALRAKVAEILPQIPPGVGLTLNALYINPRQFTFQLPLWQDMKREGIPVEGFCVAAGIPSTEKAAEIIEGLKASGIRHISFKPGSIDGIRQVVAIAAAHPDYPVILQWTGGRAGGHHSCEDFHQPILSTYAYIRQHKNVILLAGSGFGGVEDTWPYLSGEWSTSMFGVQPMPFDGFLFASWAMVAKEAHTSESVKQLIVDAKGVDDKDWEGSYTKETGGILTVRSELGEPIHKIATRGVKLWKEFDDTVFKLAKEKRAAWLAQNRDSVIQKLNRDFSKPWFPAKKDGTVVYDFGDMTYEEVVLRMIRLQYVAHEKRWVDISLRDLTGEYIRRVEERFAGGAVVSILQSYSQLDDPTEFCKKFFDAYPKAAEQLVASEDAKYFLTIAQRPGHKPVPYVPILDADFEVWFKKDSLWAAEDIEAVFDQDPQRVCILQGPVAAKRSTVANRPIKDMLGDIENGLVQKILETVYGGDESQVPTVGYIGGSVPRITDICVEKGIHVQQTDGVFECRIGSKIPDVESWLECISGPSVGWLRALLTAPIVVQEKSFIDNPLKRLFAPRKGQKVVVDHPEATISLYGAARSFGPHPADFKAVEAKFDASGQINVTINEERKGASIPLTLIYTYRPNQGYAPIHEVMEDRNTRIKDFYWRLWFGEDEKMPCLDSKQVFEGPEVTIDTTEIERFCAVVRNDGEAFKGARTENVRAPLDFAIVTGWQAIIQAIFPDSIDGDLLRLVHLSNEFKSIPGARPLEAGDVCKSEARISSVLNTDAGKAVKVTGIVKRGDDAVIEVTSAFLYRGKFTDFHQTFETKQEDDCVVYIETPADVAVLQSKGWFQWDNDATPLLAGTKLLFVVNSELVYHDKNTFASIEVNGYAYVRNQLKELIKVATIHYTAGRSFGNPVVAYLQRHGTAEGKPVLFENGGYSLTLSSSATYTAPSTNEPYSKVSRDFNPIHVNPYFSDFASLPATITHGMWSSAATRKYVETIAAQGRPERVSSYSVDFVGMVVPGDELTVKLKHIGMREGALVLKVETTNQRSEKVLEGTAEVAQPTTVYVFTGQGSQEPGMGMELYNSSPAARAVWDAADEHLLAVYGFSIIDIVKNNPKTKTIHFGGIKGQAIRERYMQMSYDTMDKDGNVKTLPLFADINVRTMLYTFSHPAGLLFATQFAQIALVVTEKAAFEDMRSKGFVQKECAFAGHSLGEYSALASIADVLPISALVDVVFYRGITMQRAVERDAQNRSNYAMCAVNPSRISKTFDDAALREVVETISGKTGLLLQIVNYNVEGQQYVCAGELVALEILTNVLNYLKVQKVDIPSLVAKIGEEKVKEMLGQVLEESYAKAQAKQKAEGYIRLERGFATIPLPGIDVPFHSRYLWAGVMPFRAYLSKRINPAQLNPDMLIGKYVPNLVAKPFDVTKEYAQIIYDQTSSPRLDKILKNWDEEEWGADAQRRNLAYAILVELLAYQFASPVRWIETQDLLFVKYDFERLIEVGPSPTLTGMASRTLNAKYEAGDNSTSRTRTILCHAKNQKEIYYQFEDQPEAAAPEPATPTVTVEVSASPVTVATPPFPASSGPVAQVPDEPLRAIDTLLVIIAQKLKKRVGEIPLNKAIKDLVGGKSTLQNEILGDLGAEFATAPEKGEELPLDELAAALSSGYSGALGKVTGGLVSRLIGGKMPGGFNASSIKAYLSKQWGLGPQRADAALLLGVTFEPAKRMGSEAEAKTWLDTVAAAYAKQVGISLSSGGSGGGNANGGGGAVMNSEEFLKFKAEQHEFAAHQVELYMRYLDRDSREGGRLYDQEKANSLSLQSRLDEISREHGDGYLQGVMPIFDPLKARHFDSAWNWARQDALIMFYDIIFGRLATVDRQITARCIAIMNRADPVLLQFFQYNIDKTDPARGETYRLAKQFGQQLIDNCREVLGQPPMYKDVTFPTAPFTEVTEQGDIVYKEVVREDCRKLEAYVQQMSSPSATSTAIDVHKLHANLANLWKLVQSQPEISEDQRTRIKNLYEGVVRSLRKPSTPAPPRAPAPAPRNRRSSSQFLRPQIPVRPTTVPEDRVPLLHLKRKIGSSWEYSSNLTSLYLDVLSEIATSGTTFQDKNALLTGVGKGSIGVEIVKGLLSGGARVVITTSRYSRATVEYYQDLYQRFGADGSALTVVPFNQGSRQDVEALVDYIYTTLGLDLDYILPFAAIPENGREIDGIDDKSELAHRVMLTNLYRLMGAVKSKKASRNFVTRPTQVVLPLSPNHGLFGNDGLYPESKISLENLFTRWSSESWGEYLCLAGAVIGWTRGTALMAPTNIVAHQLETYGVRTFSAKEMAFNILGLMHPLLFSITQVEPLWADLSGAMDRPDLAEITTRIRNGLIQEGEKRKAISRDTSLDYTVIHGHEAGRVLQTVKVTPRANFKFDFPHLEEGVSLKDLAHLRGLIDLDKVIVVTGFAEIGPWGSSRTRWEMEARGEFTLEGCIEMAWMMGYIKHYNGRLKNGDLYVGWVDAKSGESVSDSEVKHRYEKDILSHSGIRLIEPELFNGYDPLKKTFYQEVQLNHDLEPLEVAEAEAHKFKLQHEDKVDIWSTPSGEWYVKLKKGARIIVPKSFRFNRLVAGQIPTGWSAGRYGIPDDIIAQVDRTALWALVCTAEALTMSGITDPYELYKYVHPSEVGSSLGSGMGGTQSIASMFKDRREEKDVQKDIFQETYINTVAGWVNLLLMSSSGPIKIPVGACATALQSLEIACDTLLSGKAKVMIAGGFDDFSEEGSYEFANMGATSNAETEFAMGREPNEFSRPTTSTRAGFMEAQGTGIQILMTASTALRMGATIRGIVAFTSTSTDKAGRSIPAPGRGVLSIARELTPKTPLPILDIGYRTRQLAFRRKQIAQWVENERELLQEEIQMRQDAGESTDDFIAPRLANIEEEARRQEKDAQATFGMLQGADPRIAPLRRALAVWGLTADDIGVISIHGTSTKANDKNESHVYNDIFKQLQRTPGNAVPVIAQKNLTGHPKGGAAAWMLLGLCQSIGTGIVPGNRNADNIDVELRKFEYLMYPSKTIHTDGIRAGLMTSFGFGQVGGSALILHPRFLFGALEPAAYNEYKKANNARALSAYKVMSEMMITHSLVKVKDHPPFTPELEAPVLLNPLARVTCDKAGELSFPLKLTSAPILDLANLSVMKETLKKTGDTAGVGVDQELISSFPSHNPTFVTRNFTDKEVAYCNAQPNPTASFSARWAGKEAVFKSLGVASRGAGASMRDIEILPDESGVPQVHLHDDAKAAAEGKNIAHIHISLSHSDTVAIAFAQATF